MWNKYRKVGITEMRSYVLGEDMTGISVSPADLLLESLEGGFIARNPLDENDQWYIALTYHKDNFILI